MTDIPHWACKRACELLNQESSYKRYTWPEATGVLGIRTIAKLVMQYEQPPADPDEEAVKRIAGAMYFCADAHAYFSLHPDLLARAVSQYKQEKANG